MTARRSQSAAPAFGTGRTPSKTRDERGRGPAMTASVSRDNNNNNNSYNNSYSNSNNFRSAIQRQPPSVHVPSTAADRQRSVPLRGAGADAGAGAGAAGTIRGSAGVAGRGGGRGRAGAGGAGGGGGGGSGRPWGDSQAVLKRIRQEQDKGSYQRALREIKNGRKTGHWIWFIWPCLHVLRPNTSRPMFLLPDPGAAQDYLKNEVLRARLMEITEVAVGHLRSGVAPTTLFGSLTDSEKFSETMTFFAVAAKENRNQELAEFFLNALDATMKRPGSAAHLDARTMEALTVSYGLVRYKGVETTSDLRKPLSSGLSTPIT